MRFLAVGVIVLLASRSSASAAQKQNLAACQGADRALAARQYEAAIQQYEDCLKAGGASYEILGSLGVAYAQLGRFAEAMTAYQQALALSPENPKLHSNLGLAYLKSQQYQEAAREFTRALLVEPDNAQMEELLAYSHYQLQQYELAALEAERVRKVKPDEASAAFLLGSAYLRMGLYDKAIPLIDLALKKTGSAETRLIMGEALLGVRAFREALEQLKQAEALKPKLPGLHSDLGTAYAGLGNSNLAMEEFQKELEQNPNDFQANYFLGRLRRLSGDKASAKKLLDRADQIRPGDPVVGYEFAVFALEDKDYAKAESLLRRIVAKYPDYADAHVLLSEIYFRMRRPEEGQREKSVVDSLRKAEQERQTAMGKPGTPAEGSSPPGKARQP